MLLSLGQLDTGSAGDRAELSLAGELPVSHRARPPARRPIPPGLHRAFCVPLQRTGHISSKPPKTQPALEGFIIMQISWIGSAPSEDAWGGRRTELPPERPVEPPIKPVDGWGLGEGHGAGAGATDVPPRGGWWEWGVPGTGAGGRQAQAPGILAEDGTGDRHAFWMYSLCTEPFYDSSVSKYQLRGDLFLTSL